MPLAGSKMREEEMSSGAIPAEQNRVTLSQLELEVTTCRAREVSGIVSGGRKCVIQQGNILSLDDQWDCWITEKRDGVVESLHWAAPSLKELVMIGRVRYAVNLLEMSLLPRNTAFRTLQSEDRK